MKENFLRISTSVEKESYEQIRKISDEQNISINLAIRMAIEDYLIENVNKNYDKESFKISTRKRTKEERQQDWNNNIFSLRTSDEASATIKNYCRENKITFNAFFKKLVDDFFGKSLSKSTNIISEKNENLERSSKNFKRIAISVVKEHYEQIKKISDERFISSGLIIRRAINKFVEAKSSGNIKKEPLVNPIKENSIGNIKKEPLVNPIKENSIGNIKKEPLVNLIKENSSGNIKKEPLVNPIKRNLENQSKKMQKSNQREEDIFAKLEKLIDYKNNELISEAEFKLLKSKLFDF